MNAVSVLLPFLRALLVEYIKAADAFGADAEIESWVQFAIQGLSGDERDATEAACRVVWAELN